MKIPRSSQPLFALLSTMTSTTNTHTPTSSIPETMKAIVYGNGIESRILPTPTLAAGRRQRQNHVLVRVHAAGLNPNTFGLLDGATTTYADVPAGTYTVT